MKHTLTATDRNFLTQVANSIFANPFARNRHLSDCRLTGQSEQKIPATVREAAIEHVNHKVRELIRENKANILAYGSRDRQRIANLFLFHLFHKYLDSFDKHILDQTRNPEPIPLQCDKSLAKELSRFGFSKPDTDKYIALFFQMRRAYFFINTSLIGCSPCMEALRAHLWNTIFTHDIGRYAEILWNRLEDFSTLLLGETGTGKGLAAAAIGRSGFIPYNHKTGYFATSFTSAFLSINLCQFPEQLLESELFGHARGSFTGAVNDHQGIFCRSSRHGAVFLDEIGEVSIPTQIKLLRILQERSFTPVGSHEENRFEGRIIAATNRDLGQLINQGKFREDFYFRLCTDTLTMPPLRQRITEDREELQRLTAHLIQKITGRPVKVLTEEVIRELNRPANRNHSWPGNVRELEQTIRRIILHGTCIWPQRVSRENGWEADLSRQQLSVAEMTNRYCDTLFRQHGTLQAVARITGLDRRTVKNKLKS